MAISKYCEACGEGLLSSAVICPKCGSPTLQSREASQSGKNNLSNLAIVFSVISVLFFPIVFGPVALILGILAAVQKEPRGNLALALSIVCPIMGFIFGFVFAAMSYGLHGSLN